MTQTNPDPSLTHTFTTREVGEGVTCERQLRELNAAIMAFSETVKRQSRCVRDAAQEKRNAYLHREIDNLRSKLATLQRLGDEMYHAGDELFGHIEGGFSLYHNGQPSDELAAHRDALVAWSLAQPRAEEEPALTEEFHKAADIEASVPITAGSGLTPTPTEAEVERLRGEVNSLESQIARESWIEGCEQLKADLAASQARNADLRAKLDALVGAVDAYNYRATDANWRDILLAADAARQPTEAR